MKNLYFLIIAISVSLFCSAQSKETHLEFMGLPISGSAEFFIPRLEEKGFVKVDTFESSTKFIGKFANEIVNLTLLASPRTNTVCKVIVYFPEKNSWAELQSDYFKKKKLYRIKYLLTDDFEFFSNPYENGDGYEMRAVVNEKCNYHSFLRRREVLLV